MLKENNQHVRFGNINETCKKILFGFSAKSDIWKVTNTFRASWAPWFWIDSNANKVSCCQYSDALQCKNISAPRFPVWQRPIFQTVGPVKPGKSCAWWHRRGNDPTTLEVRRKSSLSFQQCCVVENWAVVVLRQLPSVKAFLTFTDFADVRGCFQKIQSGCQVSRVWRKKLWPAASLHFSVDGFPGHPSAPKELSGKRHSVQTNRAVAVSVKLWLLTRSKARVAPEQPDVDSQIKSNHWSNTQKQISAKENSHQCFTSCASAFTVN